MQMRITDGQVALNVEGKRYSATFRIEAGVMTVTCGDASRTIEITDVQDPKSVARTVLRTMILEEEGAATPAAEAASVLDRQLAEALARSFYLSRPGPRSRTRH
jgi:hypothetical protein